ncbi:hypothetical protein BT93_F1435 [Corymbia citriodora subsp. variegata]|nr:hypothetical protein BT93_F1435 [Corymbia citriodora subsp. variegata]
MLRMKIFRCFLVFTLKLKVSTASTGFCIRLFAWTQSFFHSRGIFVTLYSR